MIGSRSQILVTSSLPSSFLGFALLWGMVLGGCSGGGEVEPGTGETVKAQSPPPTGPTAASGEQSSLTPESQAQVLARVGDTVITLGDFESRLQSQAPFARARYASPQRREEFLNNVIQFEVLAAEAAQKGYDKDPEVVLAMKQTMVRKLMANEVQNLLAPGDVTEDEMKQYYQANLEEYHKPEQVRAGHLVVKDREVAQKLKSEITASIEDNRAGFRRIFADKVRQYSIDEATKPRGGDLRFFAAAGAEAGSLGIPAEVVEAAFGLERVGDLSDPVKTKAGWHLVMLTGRKNKYERSFDQVKHQIQNRLYREKKQQATESFVANLKAQAKVEVNEKLLAELEEAMAKEGSGGDMVPLQERLPQAPDFSRTPKKMRTPDPAALQGDGADDGDEQE